MVNKTLLYGYLVADPESRQTKSGKSICSMRVAHKENYKDATKEPLYINVDVWDKEGETCAKFLKKGSSVIVDGRLESDSYQNKENQKVTKIFIVAQKVTFVPRFEKSDKTDASPAVKAKAVETNNDSSNSEEDGDVPF